MIRLAECTSREAARLARDPRALVILPLGAVEQHGPHLPLLVDWLGAEELARHVAPHLARAGYRVVLAPALPYGASPLAETWPGTVSLSRATLTRVIVEVIGSLARHGFRRFVLANYQADPAHVRAMGEAKRALTRGDWRLRILFAGLSPEAWSMAAMLDPRVPRLSRSRIRRESGTPANSRPRWCWRGDRTWCAAWWRAGFRRCGWTSRCAPEGSAAVQADHAGSRRLLRLARRGAGGDREAGARAVGQADGGGDYPNARPGSPPPTGRRRPGAEPGPDQGENDADWTSQKPAISSPRHQPPRRSQEALSSASAYVGPEACRCNH